MARQACASRLGRFILAGLLVHAACARPQGAAIQTVATPRQLLTLAQIEPSPELPAARSGPAPDSSTAAAAQREFDRGLRHYLAQRWPEAAASFDRAVAADPRMWDAGVMLARCALRRGDTAAARQALSRVIEGDPRNAAAYQLMGELDVQAGRPDEAQRSFRLALAAGESTPDAPEVVLAHLSLALLLERQDYLTAAADEWSAFLAAADRIQDTDALLPDLREALEAHRDRGRLALADVLTRLSRHEEAARVYAVALASDPDNADLERRSALALLRSGDADRAFGVARARIAAAPGQPGGYDLLRALCEEGGGEARWIAELQNLAADAREPRLVARLARLLREAGRSSDAARLLDRAGSKDSLPAEGRLLQAELLAESGDVAGATARLADALEKDPSLAERVLAVCQSGRLGEQQELVRKTVASIVDERPGHAAARFMLAALLSRSGDLSQATAAFEQTLAASDDFDPAAYRELVGLYRRQRRWTDVIRTADEAIERKIADADIYLAKGLAHDALEEDDKTDQAFLDALAVDRRRPEPLFELGRAAERRRQYKKAIQFYTRLVNDVDPRFDAARARLIELLFNAREFDEAGEYCAGFEELGRSGPIVERCRAILALRDSKAQTDEARLGEYIAALRRISAAHPADVATRVEIARVLLSNRRFADALVELERALAIDADDENALRLKAESLAGLFRFDGAILAVRSLLTHRPRDLDYHRRLLEYGNAHGDYAAAADALKGMRRLPALSAMEEALVGQTIATLIAAGRHDDAIAEAREWLKASPDDPLRRGGLLSALGSAGRHDEAVALAETYLAEDPGAAAARLELLARLQDAGRHDEAQQRILDWLAQRPDDASLGFWLAWQCFSGRRWDDAIELARQGIADGGSAAERFEEIFVQACLAAGRHDDAIDFCQARTERLERAARADDIVDRMGLQQAIRDYQRAALDQARVLIVCGRYVEAERLILRLLQPYTAAMEQGRPFDTAAVADLRNLLSEVYQATDRLSQSIEQLEEVVRLNPEDPGAANNLGYVLADAGRDLERAEQLLRASLAANPQSYATLDSLGWVRYKRGEFADAAYHLGQALRVSREKDPVIHDHLADALYRLNQRSEAERHWREAIRLCEAESGESALRERRELRTSLREKLDQLAAGRSVKTAAVVAAPASAPAP